LIEWLRRIARGEHQQGDPVSEYVDIAEDPRTWLDAGPLLSKRVSDAAGDLCRSACPVRGACVGDRCNIYRIDHAARGGIGEQAINDPGWDEAGP
jgi:hypothetical protein